MEGDLARIFASKQLDPANKCTYMSPRKRSVVERKMCWNMQDTKHLFNSPFGNPVDSFTKISFFFDLYMGVMYI